MEVIRVENLSKLYDLGQTGTAMVAHWEILKQRKNFEYF